MKHQKEWHTCDRCGEKIKNTLIRKGKMNIKTEVQERFCGVYEE
jgi:ribosomal protein L37E